MLFEVHTRAAFLSRHFLVRPPCFGRRALPVEDRRGHACGGDRIPQRKLRHCLRAPPRGRQVRTEHCQEIEISLRYPFKAQNLSQGLLTYFLYLGSNFLVHSQCGFFNKFCDYGEKYCLEHHSHSWVIYLVILIFIKRCDVEIRLAKNAAGRTIRLGFEP